MSKELELAKKALKDLKEDLDRPFLSFTGKSVCYTIIGEALKALEIIKEKGLSLNELWYIKQNEPYSVYIEKMREVYFDDECVVEGKLKAQEEYELLREVLQ